MQRAFSSAKLQAPAARARGVVAARAHAERREVLLAGAGAALAAVSAAAPQQAAAAEKIELPVSSLSTFEKADQRKQLLTRAQEELRKVIDKSDAPQCCRLLFNDAATYDVETQTGGMNASVVTKEELGRPENKGLDALVKRIAKAKEAIDKGNEELGSGPLSWADTIVLACKVSVQDEWRGIKLSRAADPTGGDQIVKAFGSAWDVRLGRLDAKEADPAGRVLAPGASAEEMRAYMLKLAAKPGDGGAFKPKQPFWERPAFVVYPATQDDPAGYEQRIAGESATFADLKNTYDRERRTTTRTTYEVDFIKHFSRLSELGAKFDNEAYLHSVTGYRLQ